MTAVSQKISNLVGGISQQPIEKQPPGTVKDALNVIPDIKGTLSKRPGSELVGTLSDNVEGKWHNYYRDDNELYFIRVRKTGQVDVWSALDGTPRLVTYTNTPIDVQDLNSVEPSDDATGICQSCNEDDFKSLTIDLQKARTALQDQKSEIERIDLRLAKEDLTDAERAALEAEKATLQSEIPGLLDDYTDALAAYEPMAENCGIYNNPYSRAARVTCADPRQLEYFAHTEDQDIQMTTINDYTFVTNRTKTVNMDAAVDKDDKYEAFFYINQVAYDTIYSVNRWDANPDDDNQRTVQQATAVDLVKSVQTDSEAQGAASESQVFTNNGITYRLNVVRTDFIEGDQDGGDNYDCEWRATVDFITSDPAIQSPNKGTVIGTHDMLGRTWQVRVKETETIIIDSDQIITVGPYNVDSGGIISAATILNDFKDEFNAIAGMTAEVIGNGIFLSSDTAFAIDTSEEILITIVDDKVNNVAQLPTQCKGGYVVKVVNSFLEEDDYYVKFVLNETVLETGASAGDGVWEETFKPGIKVAFDYTTMPHAIRRLPNSTFEVSPIKWGEREVGDDVTNPIPSFDGQKINKIMFFRNRFVMLSGENVVMSRPNEYFNFWANTAQVVSDGDPIDLLVSSTYPAILYDGIETSSGLQLFSINQQFVVSTDNTDIFSPRTANIKAVASYKYNKEVRPVNMGQAIGFVNNAGYRSRFFMMLPNRDYDYQAVEVSKPVDSLIPKDINLVADSKDDNLLGLSVKGEDDIWVYRYFIQNDQQVQSAWFRWKLSSNILYHCIMDDKLYAVLDVETGNPSVPHIATLQSFDIKLDRDSVLIKLADDMRQYDYQVHMDNYYMATPAEMIYDSAAKTTTWRLPIGFHSPKPLVVYELELNHAEEQGYIVTGRVAELTSVGASNGVFVTAPGDWTKANAICGYNFDMEVKMPTMYYSKRVSQTQTVTDTRAYLTLHRVVMSYEATGMVDTVVKRKGREDYVLKQEATIQDGYIADSTPVEQDVQRTVPIYDKNTNTDIILTSHHPTPTNLVSVYWEGDYNNRNYKNV